MHYVRQNFKPVDLENLGFQAFSGIHYSNLLFSIFQYSIFHRFIELLHSRGSYFYCSLELEDKLLVNFESFLLKIYFQ